MKCAACTLDAQYEYATGPMSSMLFCAGHVPGFLKTKTGRLMLKIYEPEVVAPKVSKKKKAEVAVPKEESLEEVSTPTEE
jgi:hypothetical protein